MGCPLLSASPRHCAGVVPFGNAKLHHSCRRQFPGHWHENCSHRVRKRNYVLTARAETCLEWVRQAIHKPLLVSGLALAAAGLVAGTPPALAELQTVPPDTALAAARPLPKQPVNKGTVWLLFGLGATGTFGFALFLENQERFFPAIVRANKALAAGRKAQEEREKREKLMTAIEAQMPPEDRLQDAVAEGLLAARARSGITAGVPSAEPGETPAEPGRLTTGTDSKQETLPADPGPVSAETNLKQETPEGSSGADMAEARGGGSPGVFPGELRQDAEGVEIGQGGGEGGEVRGEGKEPAVPNGAGTLHANGVEATGGETAHGESEAERAKAGVGSSGGEVGLDEWMRLRSQQKEKAASS